MELPVISDVATDPIYIDSGVAYTYPIPVTGATSIGYTPNANFTLALSGNVLTFTYIGGIVTTTSTQTIVVFASNAAGTTTLDINVAIRASTLFTSTTFAVTSTGTTDLNFGSTIGAKLSVNDVMIAAPASAADGIYHVSYVSGSTFRIANGAGTDQTFSAGTVYVRVAIVQTRAPGDDVIFWVGPTAALAIDQPIKIAYHIGTILTAYSGVLYVREILDGYRVKLGDAAGVLTSAGVYVNIADVSDILGGGVVQTFSGAAGREFPKITSASNVAVAVGGAVSYTLTDDSSADGYFARQLPDGLTISSGVIAGTAPLVAGLYPIILEAYKGANVSFRYLLLQAYD
jgi:hypothetical protein